VRKNIILVILLLGILSFLWMTNLNREPVGTDNQAVNLIENINPGYSPWFRLPWELPDKQTEGRLFALQAAVGSGLICFYLGYLMGRNRGKENV
jgi:cobalt/nickel transport protein